MAIQRRGLQEIRTFSGRVDQASIPYRAYLKISCLEMEKVRKGREKHAALGRLKNINARFREIEAEKDRLFKALGERNAGKSIDALEIEPKPAPCKNTGGFKLRY
jgi:hypothetical protein